MPSYKPSIVGDVERSIGAINNIVVTLQRDGDVFSSDIIQFNCSQSTVDDFLSYSKVVVDNLLNACSTTANWLAETGDGISRNLNEAARVAESVRDAISKLNKAEEHKKATEARVSTLESDIRAGEGNLSSAQHALCNAKNELDNQETARNVLRVGAFITFFFAPIISVALTAIDIAGIQRAVDQQESTIRSIEGQLASSRAQLQSQRDSLSAERAEITRISDRTAALRREQDRLEAEGRRLDAERTTLSDLSMRINDCLHTVNAALSSSATIATMCSMRNVVVGIRGIVVALGADDMFAGPLAQLNDAALGTLDRRVAAIRRHKLTV